MTSNSDTEPPSSPDPLSLSTNPHHSSSSYATERLRAMSARRSVTPAPPTPSRGPLKFSHTSEIDTNSPWRIRVCVEAERDDEGPEGDERGDRKPTTLTAGRGGTVTMKVPVKGLESSPEKNEEAGKKSTIRKATPRRRKGSIGEKIDDEGVNNLKPKSRARSRGKKAVVPDETQMEEEEEEQEELEPKSKPRAKSRGKTTMRKTRGRKPVEEDEEMGDTIVVGSRDESVVAPTPAAKVARRKSTTKKPRVTKKTLANEENEEAGDSIVVEKPPVTKRIPAKKATPAKPTTARDQKKSTTSSANAENELPHRRSPKSYTPRGKTNRGRGPTTPQMDDTLARAGVDTYGKPGKAPPVGLNADEDSENEPLPQAPPVEDDSEEFPHGLSDQENFKPDFTYLSTGTSYTPKVKKKGALDPSSPVLDKEVDGVGADTFYGDEDSDMELLEAGFTHPDVEELPLGTPYKMKGALDGTPRSLNGHDSSPLAADINSYFKNRSTSKGRATETSRHSIATPEASSPSTGSNSFTQSQRSPIDKSRYVTPSVSGSPAIPPRVPTARRRSGFGSTPSLDRIVEASSTLGGVIDTFEERAAVQDSIVRGVTDSMSSQEDPHYKRILTPESIEENETEAQNVLTSLGEGIISTGFTTIFEPSSLAFVSQAPSIPAHTTPPKPNTSFTSIPSSSHHQSPSTAVTASQTPSNRTPSNRTPSNRTLLLEQQWAAERAANSARALEVGAITINDDDGSDTSSHHISTPKTASTPNTSSTRSPSQAGDRTQLLEEQYAASRLAVIQRAQEIGAITIHADDSSVLILPSTSPSRRLNTTKSFNASLAHHLSSSPQPYPQYITSTHQTFTSEESDFLPQHLLWKPSHYAHLQAVLNSSKTPERGECGYAVWIDMGHKSLKEVEREKLGVDAEGWMRLGDKEAAAVERFVDREKRGGGVEWGRREVVRRIAGLRIARVVGEGGK